MEKYSQFRDRSTGIAPFLPHTTSVSTPKLALHAVIFLFRLPLFVTYALVYFLFLTYLPLPAVVRKLLLWGMLGIPGIWWVDLQLDGVKRGSLSQQPASRVPQPGSIVAAQFTSPVDALYLAAIFDPVFVVSYPGTTRVRRVSLLGAVLQALAPVRLAPAPADRARLTTLRALAARHRHRVLVVFPECSTTNGKGILPFSPSLTAAPQAAPIFPLSMRYTPQDITTPVPATYATFLWNLLSRPTHLIRVRIAEAVTNRDVVGDADHPDLAPSESDGDEDADDADEKPTSEQYRVLDRIGEALARLARNKRVGLTLRDKAAFVEAWTKGRR